MTDQLKTSALPVSASSRKKKKKSIKKKSEKGRIGHSLDCKVYGWKRGHFVGLDRTLWPGFVSAGVITKKKVFFVGGAGG